MTELELDSRIAKVQPHIKILSQWAIGKKIELKHKIDPHAVWIQRDKPEWNFADYEFRVCDENHEKPNAQ